MNIKLITVCSHPEHAGMLITSAQKQGWDLEVIVSSQWRGFGTKLIETYNYLKAHPEVERFVFADAFDVVVLGTPEEFESKIPNQNMFLSAEKGLWPPILIPFKEQYSIYEQDKGFNYPNSGLYYAKSKFFIEMYEKYPPFYEIDDQYWMNMVYLFQNFDEDDYLVCDNSQSVFNSHSFIADGEYIYHYDIKRIEIMGNMPIFAHKNGKSVDEKLDNMLM